VNQKLLWTPGQQCEELVETPCAKYYSNVTLCYEYGEHIEHSKKKFNCISRG